MRLTLIQPAMGRKLGQKYIKTWQMEPLPPATIAGLTPPEVEVRFYDDRMEPVPYDEPTDLVAISVETYTAKRSYQIASEFRRRSVPVVMGGFHPTLCPEEVSQYAESVVIGEAEGLWEKVIADAERGTLQPYYSSPHRPDLSQLKPDRSIYKGKRYLPLALVETTRGCRYLCNFCSIQTFFNQSQNARPFDTLLAELKSIRHKPLVFFVDDNITADIDQAKSFFKALIPLKLRWVSQASINLAADEELLQLMVASGCQGVLIGLESLNPKNLALMNKRVNLAHGDFEKALATLNRHQIRLYITFVFGYDEDTEDSFAETLQFAIEQKFYLAAFNHLTPFPGTALYRSLEAQGRLLYEKWWLDDQYAYNRVPFRPQRMSPERIQHKCVETRTIYYNWRNIWQRGLSPVNRQNPVMWLSYYWINALFHQEVNMRDNYPLGDQAWGGEWIKVRERPLPNPTKNG
jgi:radical SAM superfamily enzyme YgiQ (UPF0313 family)